MHYFVSMPFYPKNIVNPQCRTRSKPNLNIIFVLIIVTHAQGSVPIKKYGGQVYLAAPYCRGPPPRHQHTIHTSFYKYGGSHMTPHQINSIFTHRTHVTLHMEKRRILWNIYSEWRHEDGAIVKVKGGNTVNSHVCKIQQYACYQHETG